MKLIIGHYGQTVCNVAQHLTKIFGK